MELSRLRQLHISADAASRPGRRDQHATLKIQNTPSGRKLHLQNRAHKPRPLAEQLVSLWKYDLLQDRATIEPLFEDLRKWVHVNDAYWHHRTSDLDRDAPQLQVSFQLINTLFFKGKLDHVDLNWETKLIRGSEACYGYVERLRHGKIKMGIDPADWFEAGRASPTTTILGTLIHECIHAFLMLYSCCQHNEPCKKDKHCNKALARTIGLTGHGEAWIWLAAHMESILKHQTGLDIDLHIHEAMKHEYEESGSYVHWQMFSHYPMDMQELVSSFAATATQAENDIQRRMQGQSGSELQQYLEMDEVDRLRQVKELRKRVQFRRVIRPGATPAGGNLRASG
ncbi:hypothetical protein Slin15195_G055800 [Septoria linicola]|uniref:SprT-like domain-containing protein n=1 Tax=Septoria linicola TaxID=215465 RepID=A0A9Q9EHY0_9PEZI|nr:hypothetical protein Slin14017_G071670 [Septoria linicola]USW52261.1 hypothetical protein Slin15195_G055800 [Septoria linicola]